MSEQQEQSNVVEFQPLEFPPVEYGVTDATLAELAEQYKDPDASTDEGYEHCKEGCRALTHLRTSVETRRLDLKRPVAEWVRTHIDNRGKDLIRRIRKIEDPVRVEKERIDEIKQEEARKAAETEELRIVEIKANIKKIADTALLWSYGDKASDYKQHITWLNELEISEDIFGELVDEANTTRDASLFKLTQWHEQALRREAEDRKRKAEQAEIDRKKKELDKIEAKQKKEAACIETEKREAEEREAAAKKAADEKAKRENQEKATKESERINNIRSLIKLIERLPPMSEGMSSESIGHVIAKLKEKTPGEAAFQEFLPEAKAVWQRALDTLETMAKDAREREEKVRRDDEARLPDKDKLTRWCDALAAIPEPEVLNDKAQKILRRCGGDLLKFIERLRSDIGKL